MSNVVAVAADMWVLKRGRHPEGWLGVFWSHQFRSDWMSSCQLSICSMVNTLNPYSHSDSHTLADMSPQLHSFSHSNLKRQLLLENPHHH
jgi:hypothetical protein